MAERCAFCTKGHGTVALRKQVKGSLGGTAGKPAVTASSAAMEAAMQGTTYRIKIAVGENPALHEVRLRLTNG